ncbi:hypothetical protein MUP46_01075 [Patescibacteria group bacterium]|nr:hypothetical protein [Patescibacteria group bacterium]
MKRHVFALSMGIVLLLVLLMVTIACVPQTATPAAPADGIAYKSDIAGLQGQITAQGQSINTIAGKSGVSQADVQAAINSSLTGYVKTSDLNAAIAAYLVAHPVVATATTSTTTAGGTTATSGGYSVTLDRNQIISMASETGNKDVSVVVVNNTGASATPSLLISLIPLSPSTFATLDLNATHRCVKSTLSGFTADNQTGAVQSNSDVSTLLSKLYWITPEFSLNSGTSKSIWLNFDVRTTNVVTWTLGIKAL